MYAIIETGGRQVKVSPGETVKVQKLNSEINSEIIIDKVLMLVKDDKTILGKPYVEGASVKAELIGAGRMPKILVFGPRPKKARRRLLGHRQDFSSIKITEIIGG